jgi:hypothetical protein
VARLIVFFVPELRVRYARHLTKSKVLLLMLLAVGIALAIWAGTANHPMCHDPALCFVPNCLMWSDLYVVMPVGWTLLLIVM